MGFDSICREFPTILVVYNQAVQAKVLTIEVTAFATPCFDLLADSAISYNEWRRKQSDLYPTVMVGVLPRSKPLLKLTKKADYALMAMKHLAECASMGSRSAKDVSDAYGIPPEALAKILQRLAKAGLLQSQHGTNGGYTLARPAHTISAFLDRICYALD